MWGLRGNFFLFGRVGGNYQIYKITHAMKTRTFTRNEKLLLADLLLNLCPIYERQTLPQRNVK